MIDDDKEPEVLLPAEGDVYALIPLAPATPSELTPARAYMARLAAGSQRKQWRTLRQVVSLFTQGRGNDPDQFPWHQLTYAHSQVLRQALAAKYAAATTNTMLCAYRGVVEETWRLGRIDEETKARICDVKAVRGSTLSPGRVVEREEIDALYASCTLDPEPMRGARDAAILAVLDGGGLRRSELETALVERWDGKNRALPVVGKGNKERIAYLPTNSALLLERWLELRGLEPGPVFVWVRHNALVRNPDGQLKPLTDSTVYAMLGERIGQAGKSFTPHDLRRTFISRLLGKGVDLATVQKMAGHSDPKTTARYDRRGSDVMRDAVEVLDED